MGYSRRGHKGRVDANHAEIMAAVRKIGCSAWSVASVGEGFPDICVGMNGYNLLLEVKIARGRMTTDETQFAASWRGQVATVRSADEAVEFVRALRVFRGLKEGPSDAVV